MGTIHVAQEGQIGAPADLTYRLIADDTHHQRFLPDSFSDFGTLEGGVGAGTLHRFKFDSGRSVRERVERRSSGVARAGWLARGGYAPWQRLYFLPLPQGHGSLRAGAVARRGGCGA